METSVCIAAHNGAKYIGEQLLSILPQLKEDDEIIISDDGSTDGTIDVILSLKDPRIKIHTFQPRKTGKKAHWYVTKNFENALLKAQGDFIFLADQDDIWVPGKVSNCLERLESSDLVVSNLECVDENGSPLGRCIYGERFRFHNYLGLRGKYYGCAMAFRRTVLEYVLPFPEELLLHDYWIGMMAELLGEVQYINKPLTYYRVHPDNVSGLGQSHNTLLEKISLRAYIILNYMRRSLAFRRKVK